MKTIILTVLVIFGLLTLTNNDGIAQQIEPSVIKTYEYRLQRGDNLTRVAKRFETTKERLLWANTGNPCVKNEDLILRGCWLTIPNLVTVNEAQRVINTANRNVAAVKKTMSHQIAVDQKFNKVSNVSLTILSVILAIWLIVVCAKNNLKEEELKKLGIKLTVKDEQIAALTQAKQEAEQLRSRVPALQDELNKSIIAYADCFRRLTEFENHSPGKRYSFISKDSGLIQTAYEIIETSVGADSKPIVKTIKCLKCGITDVKPQNSNMASHYFAHVKEEIDHA